MDQEKRVLHLKVSFQFRSPPRGLFKVHDDEGLIKKEWKYTPPINTDTQTHTHTHSNTHTRHTHTHTQAHNTHIHTHTHVHTHARRYTRTYTTHTYTSTKTHTYWKVVGVFHIFCDRWKDWIHKKEFIQEEPLNVLTLCTKSNSRGISRNPGANTIKNVYLNTNSAGNYLIVCYFILGCK